jgi:hypothetical protein
MRQVMLLLLTITPLGAQSLRDEILAKERQGLDCLKSGNLAGFCAPTADDAVFVGAHGPADKGQVVKNTSEFRLDDYSSEDFSQETAAR